MPYLEQVLWEVERLHQPVGGGFRGVIKEFEFNGFHVPAGWKLLYSIVITHSLQEIYSQPERFDPDRFSPQRQEHKKYAFTGLTQLAQAIAQEVCKIRWKIEE